MDEFYELLNEYNKTKIAFSEKAISIVKNSIKNIFEKTQIKAIYWTQYTPYFNDGEECIFGVQSILVSTDVLSTFDDEESSNTYDTYYLDEKVFSHYEIELINNLVRVLRDEDMIEVLKFSFGDSVAITVTKKGISIQGYEHYY